MKKVTVVVPCSGCDYHATFWNNGRLETRNVGEDLAEAREIAYMIENLLDPENPIWKCR